MICRPGFSDYNNYGGYYGGGGGGYYYQQQQQFVQCYPRQPIFQPPVYYPQPQVCLPQGNFYKSPYEIGRKYDLWTNIVGGIFGVLNNKLPPYGGPNPLPETVPSYPYPYPGYPTGNYPGTPPTFPQDQQPQPDAPQPPTPDPKTPAPDPKAPAPDPKAPTPPADPVPDDLPPLPPEDKPAPGGTTTSTTTVETKTDNKPTTTTEVKVEEKTTPKPTTPAPADAKTPAPTAPKPTAPVAPKSFFAPQSKMLPPQQAQIVANLLRDLNATQTAPDMSLDVAELPAADKQDGLYKTFDVAGAAFGGDGQPFRAYLVPRRVEQAAPDYGVSTDRLARYIATQEVTQKNLGIYSFSEARNETLGEGVSARLDPQLATFSAGVMTLGQVLGQNEQSKGPQGYNEIATTFLNAVGKTLQQLNVGSGTVEQRGQQFIETFASSIAPNATSRQNYDSTLNAIATKAGVSKDVVEQALVANYTGNLEQIVQASKLSA